MTISRGVEAGRRDGRRRDRRRPFLLFPLHPQRLHGATTSVGDDVGDDAGRGAVGRRRPAGVKITLAGLVIDDQAEDPRISWGVGGGEREKMTTKEK